MCDHGLCTEIQASLAIMFHVEVITSDVKKCNKSEHLSSTLVGTTIRDRQITAKFRKPHPLKMITMIFLATKLVEDSGLLGRYLKDFEVKRMLGQT